MTRQKGDAVFSTSVDIVGKKPLDAKTIVQSKSDLTDAQTWKIYNATTDKTVDSFYKGMAVSVANDTEQNNGLYRLKGSDPTVPENWEKIVTSGDTTIHQWTPTLTGTPPLVTLDSLGDVGQGTTGQSFTDTSVTNGTETTQAVAVSTPLPTPLSGKYGVWAKYEGPPEDEGAGITLYYQYNLFATAEDLTFSSEPTFLLAYPAYMTGQGLVNASGADPFDVYIADWNPLVDSICTVYDADNKTLEYFTNRDTTTPIESFDLVALGITDVPYACTLCVFGSGNTVSGAKTFDLAGVQSVFGSVGDIDETDLPENAADNFFRVAGLAAPTLLASLDKLVANNDIVAFDGTGAPSQVIQDIEIPPEPDLSGYATTASVTAGLADKVDKPAGFDTESGDEGKYISGKGTLKSAASLQKIGDLDDVLFAEPNATVGSTPIGYDALVILDKTDWGFGLVTDLSNTHVENSMIVLNVQPKAYQLGNTINIPSELNSSAAGCGLIANRITDTDYLNLAHLTAAAGTSGGSTAGVECAVSWDSTTDTELENSIKMYSKTLTHNGNPIAVVVNVPASPTATGTKGQLAADANYIYYCYATDSWAKVPKADFASGGFDANKITSGILDIARIPPAAIERMHSVADDTARFALTTADVQNGDTVKVVEDDKLYLVVNDTQLATENGYLAYTSGTDLRNLNLRTYKESVSTITSASNVLALDFDNANNFNVAALDENTTVAFSNVSAMSDTLTSFTLHIKQDAVGGRTISWPASVKKVNPFTGVDTSADTVNIFEGYTLDNGTTWFVSFVGAV